MFLNSRIPMTNFLARNRVAAVSADTEVHDWVGGSPWYGLQWQQEGQSWPIFLLKLLNFEDQDEDFPVVESQNPCDFWKLETISDSLDIILCLPLAAQKTSIFRSFLAIFWPLPLLPPQDPWMQVSNFVRYLQTILGLFWTTFFMVTFAWGCPVFPWH